MVAAGMSGSMAETPRKSVGLGFHSRHVISFPFLSNLVSCTREHLATQIASYLQILLVVQALAIVATGIVTRKPNRATAIVEQGMVSYTVISKTTSCLP